MKQNQSQYKPKRLQYATSACLSMLLVALLALSFVQPALAQDVTNSGQVQVNEGTTVRFGSTVINNSTATFTNDGDIWVAGSADFQNGEIDEPNNGVVIFQDNATVANASDASHVDGWVRKIGDDAITFPTGDGGQYGAVGISAPVTGTVDARYYFANPQTDAGTALGTGVTAVSTVEYWNLNGTPSVDVTLHWDSDSNISALGGGSLTDLRVVGWDAGSAEWIDLGNAATTGDAASGTITANGVTPDDYAAYTFGTVASGGLDVNIALNPDPVGVNSLFTATVTLTNTGATNIITLPFQLDYDNNDIQLFPSTVSVNPVDFVNDGTLSWSDLTTDLGDLIPNTPVTLVVQFTAIQDTTSNPAVAPCNAAGESCLSATAANVQDGGGTVPTATANDAIDIDIGLQNKYILGDFVWDDLSKDGLKDQNEGGINGVKLNLYLDGSGPTAADGAAQQDEFLLSTTTANNPNAAEISSDGYYSFSVVTGPGKIYIVEVDESNFEQGQALEGMADTETQNPFVSAAAVQMTEMVVPMTSAGDYLDADFSFASAAANVALDVMVNTVGPARQTDPISFTVTITNLDAAPLSSLPVDVVFPKTYLDCTAADHSPTVGNNQMMWADLLATAGNVTLNQNDAISFEVNCTAGLDTTLLLNQQAVLMGMAGSASDSAGISVFAPTGVLMAERGIQVDRATGQVTIRWSTADESQIVAFNVYRKWVGDKEWTQLNDTSIVAERSSQSDGGYSFTDQLVEEVVAASVPDANYQEAHYRLGLIMVDGSEQFLDLGSTESGSQQGGEIFLPLVAK